MSCIIIIYFLTNNNFFTTQSLSLSSGNRGDLSLHEVVLHETLEVEIGELILRLDLEKSAELGVGDDLATIGLVLERVGADVRVDLLAHISTGHLSANRLAEELGKLITDASGLDKSGGLTVSRALALLGRVLLSNLHLAVHGLLERLVVALEGGEDAEKLLELGAELGHLRRHGRLNRGLDVGRRDNSGRDRLDNRSNLLLRSPGLLLGLLLGHNWDNNILDGNGGSGLLITLRSTNHSKLILYIRFFF